MTTVPDYMNGAAPQFYPGGATGCLIVHGFMASPAEVGWLGDHLARQGHTVYVPRLTGHGVDPRHMQRMRWQDWYLHALDGYTLLRAMCQQVIVIGHSMGGTLSMLLAARRALDGLVVVDSPITPTNPLMRWSRWLHYVRPFGHFPSEPELNEQILTEQQARGEPAIGRVHYDRWAIRAVYELYSLMPVARSELHHIEAPLLLLYNSAPSAVDLQDSQRIARAVRSRIVEQHVIHDGGHIVFQDAGREEAFRVVADFVKRIATRASDPA